jgi:quercetin dioxygenase-like cupin family protein
MDSTQAHAPRRDPVGAEAPLDLQVAADELLAEAGQLNAGRSARTLTPGPGAPLKQTLLALTAGQHLQDHLAPGPTTLLGIRGEAVLTHDDAAMTLTEGVWAACPVGPHSLDAVTDAVVLLTVTPAAVPHTAA